MAGVLHSNLARAGCSANALANTLPTALANVLSSAIFQHDVHSTQPTAYVNTKGMLTPNPNDASGQTSLALAKERLQVRAEHCSWVDRRGASIQGMGFNAIGQSLGLNLAA